MPDVLPAPDEDAAAADFLALPRAAYGLTRGGVLGIAVPAAALRADAGDAPRACCGEDSLDEPVPVPPPTGCLDRRGVPLPTPLAPLAEREEEEVFPGDAEDGPFAAGRTLGRRLLGAVSLAAGLDPPLPLAGLAREAPFPRLLDEDPPNSDTTTLGWRLPTPSAAAAVVVVAAVAAALLFPLAPPLLVEVDPLPGPPPPPPLPRLRGFLLREALASSSSAATAATPGMRRRRAAPSRFARA